MLYEIAQEIGEYACACLTVVPGDADEQTMVEGFACSCDPSFDPYDPASCCISIPWSGHDPDVCCGIVVKYVLSDYDEGLLANSASPACWGMRYVRFEIEFRACPPPGDHNDLSIFNDFSKFMHAVVNRLSDCFACLKKIEVSGVPYTVRNIGQMQPTDVGVLFGIEMLY